MPLAPFQNRNFEVNALEQSVPPISQNAFLNTCVVPSQMLGISLMGHYNRYPFDSISDYTLDDREGAICPIGILTGR